MSYYPCFRFEFFLYKKKKNHLDEEEKKKHMQLGGLDIFHTEQRGKKVINGAKFPNP